MRFKRHIKLERGLKQIDIAPLIDTVFLLLIFFLLTSNFVIQPGMKISLPKALTGELLSAAGLEIMVSGENTVYFGAKTITNDELRGLINQAAGRKLPVVIKADNRSSLGKTAEIWDICRASGVTQVSIATNGE